MYERWQRSLPSALAYQDVYRTSRLVLSNEHAAQGGLVVRHFHHRAGGSMYVPAIDEDLISVRLRGVTEVECTMARRFPRAWSQPGQITVHPRGVPTDVAWTAACDNVHLVLPAGLLGQVALEVGGQDPARVELIDQVTGHDAVIAQIGHALHAELQTYGSLDRVYSDSLAHMLAVQLLRQHVAVPLPRSNHARGLPPPLLRRVIGHIHEHLGQDIALADLAALAGLSPSHFLRQFKASMGVAPHQYLLQQRVLWAKQLLLDGQHSIAEVAYLAGFADQSHLHRHFKRVYGVAPRALLQAYPNSHR